MVKISAKKQPKVTEIIVNYPENQAPNWVEPQLYHPYRFGIGKVSTHPLVAICMNPSAARDQMID